MSRVECKREYVRINDQFNVRIVARDKAAQFGTREINTSKSVNISAGGLLINVAERLAVGTLVNITLMKPNTFEIFKGSGSVVRVDDDADGTCKVAINFINLSDHDKQKLDYYIHLGAL